MLGKVKIALFQSDSCGWSKRFGEVWDKLTTELVMDNIELEFVKYDANNNNHRELFTQYNVRGYPNTYIMVQVGDNTITRDFNVLQGFSPLHDENGQEGALNRIKNMITTILNYSDAEWNVFLQQEKEKKETELKLKQIWSRPVIMKYLNQPETKKVFLAFAERKYNKCKFIHFSIIIIVKLFYKYFNCYTIFI